MIRPDRIANVMGGRAILRRRVHSIRDLERTVARGLPKRALRNTVERALTNKAEARRVMFRLVPEATFKRRVRLSPAVLASSSVPRSAWRRFRRRWDGGGPQSGRHASGWDAVNKPIEQFFHLAGAQFRHRRFQRAPPPQLRVTPGKPLTGVLLIVPGILCSSDNAREPLRPLTFGRG